MPNLEMFLLKKVVNFVGCSFFKNKHDLKIIVIQQFQSELTNHGFLTFQLLQVQYTCCML